ncbi:hypothetical protein M885DRAFT_547486 [Pelagophyceae sp. CCMP2097]|nr:hypothetical protein M885DRAFT_547486 [Pelagophyceae sp. CCMP2097]
MVLRAQMKAWQGYESLAAEARRLESRRAVPAGRKADVAALQTAAEVDAWLARRENEFGAFRADVNDDRLAEACGAYDVSAREVEALRRHFAAARSAAREGPAGDLSAGGLRRLLGDMGGADYTAAEVEAVAARINECDGIQFAEFVKWWAGGLDGEVVARGAADEAAPCGARPPDAARRVVVDVVEREAPAAPLLSGYVVIKTSRSEVAAGVAVYTERLARADGAAAWRFYALCTQSRAAPAMIAGRWRGGGDRSARRAMARAARSRGRVGRCRGAEVRVDFAGSSGVAIADVAPGAACDGGVVVCEAPPFERVLVATLLQASTPWSLKYALEADDVDPSRAAEMWRGAAASAPPRDDGGYVDAAFPRAPQSIIGADVDDDELRSSASRAVWRRAAVARGPLAPAQIRCGALRNPWLAGAMAALAERAGLLESLARPAGAHRYAMSLCVDGAPRSVDVDDFVPCYGPRGAPLFTAGLDEESQLPALLEKACAKAFGSYAALRRGAVADGLLLLTGAPTEAVRLRDARAADRVASGQLWDQLRTWVECGAVASAALPDREGRAGASLAVVAALEVRVGDDVYRAVKLRDTAGCDVIGRYPNEGSEALRGVLRGLDAARYRRLMSTEDHDDEDDDDGCVWIGWEDLVERFDVLSICLVASRRQKLWETLRRTVSIGAGAPAAFVFRVAADGGASHDAFVSAAQADTRGALAPPYVDVALMLLRERAAGGYDVIFAAFPALDRSVASPQLHLARGDYVCLAWSAGARGRGAERPVALTVHCDAPITFVRALPAADAADALSDAADGAIRQLGEAAPYPEHGFVIYTLSGGGNGVSFAVENLGLDMLVFTMDCSNAANAESHRGALSWTEPVDPQSVAVIHHLQPAGPGTWSWSYECEWAREAA